MPFLVKKKNNFRVNHDPRLFGDSLCLYYRVANQFNRSKVVKILLLVKKATSECLFVPNIGASLHIRMVRIYSDSLRGITVLSCRTSTATD